MEFTDQVQVKEKTLWAKLKRFNKLLCILGPRNDLRTPLQIGNSHYEPSLLLMKIVVAQHNSKLIT